MTGFCCFKSDVNRFWISHFSDQNDIGILPKRVLQSQRKTIGIQSHFALSDSRFDLWMNELDRVFDCYDVKRVPVIDVVDHRGNSRAFPGARASRDEN